MNKKLTTLIVSFMIGALMCIIPNPAHANTTQPRWNKCTLTYAINFTNIDNPRKEYRKIKRVLSTISKHTKIKFQYVGYTETYMPVMYPTTAAPADIVIAYPNKKQSDLYNPNGGTANIHYDNNGSMVHAAFVIAPIYANNKGYQPLYLHELIHTIGYNQHTNDLTSIMNPTVYATKLSHADKKMLGTIGREMGCR